MHAEKMWSWIDWKTNGKDFPDLSYERSIEGTIPLECPGLLRTNRSCETKLYDGIPNKEEGTCVVFCSMCAFKGTRILGKFKRVKK